MVQELDRLGWLSKQWTTRKGTVRCGPPNNKNSLHCMLRNVNRTQQDKIEGALWSVFDLACEAGIDVIFEATMGSTAPSMGE